MKSLLKLLLIFNLIISPIMLWGQADSIKVEPKPNAFIAVDIFYPVYGLFTDKKGVEAAITYPVSKKIHLALEVGYEENKYDKTSWLADASGPFARLGAQYFISQDYENPNMGFYLGGRVGYSSYKQTVDSFLIQGNDGDNITSSLPEHDASTYWFEPLAGGRVQIREWPVYIDASVRLKIKIKHDNDYDITSLVIPGFGTDNSGIGLGFNWSIGYALPF